MGIGEDDERVCNAGEEKLSGKDGNTEKNEHKEKTMDMAGRAVSGSAASGYAGSGEGSKAKAEQDKRYPF